MGAEVPKQFIELGGKAILQKTIEVFMEACPDISVITVLPESYIDYWRQYCLDRNFICPQILVKGGITRFQSVKNALAKVPEGALVAVHDGARPLISLEVIDRTVRAAHTYGAAAPAVPVKDTIKVVRGGVVSETPDRSTLQAVQTPQVFDADLLRGALQKAKEDNAQITDDCSAVERMGMSVKIVEGDERNIKVTTPMDLKVAEMLLEEMQ